MEAKRLVPICAIYDNLCGYKNIYIIQNEAVAKRAFTNSLISLIESGDYVDSSPADLSLYSLGYLDMDSGDIQVHEPRAIVHGTSIITEYNISKCNRDHNIQTSKVGEDNVNF